MRRVCAAALVAAFVVSLAGCGSARRVSLPAADVEMLDEIGRSELAKFVEHYQALYAEQRPPTDEEYGYWVAKYEQLRQLYLWAKGRISVDEIDPQLLKGALETVLTVLF